MVVLCHWQNQRLGLEVSCGEDVHLPSDSLCKRDIKLECNTTKLLALFFQNFNSLGIRLISRCFALFVVKQIAVQDVQSGYKMLPFCLCTKSELLCLNCQITYLRGIIAKGGFPICCSFRSLGMWGIQLWAEKQNSSLVSHL